MLVVAPASADFLAKAAHGLADDLLSTLYLAFTGRVLMAPAMNTAMWEKPAVQRNITQLRADGVQFVEPGSGWLSCRQVGAGRMAEPETILATIRGLLERPLSGQSRTGDQPVSALMNCGTPATNSSPIGTIASPPRATQTRRPRRCVARSPPGAALSLFALALWRWPLERAISNRNANLER